MPVDPAPVAAGQRKPGDLGHPVADRDQMHPTVSAATHTNAGDLVKRHVDHATHLQPVVVRLTFFRHGRGSLQTSRRTYNHCLMISRVSCPIHFENGNARVGRYRSLMGRGPEPLPDADAFKSLADLSAMFGPILTGWLKYYGHFHGSAL